ncbi:MAG: MMPL family transporter [Pseudomonadota bacterium]
MATTLRNSVERGFVLFGHFVYHHHWFMLGLTILFSAALLSQLPKLTMDTSTEGFLHEEDPILLDYHRLLAQYGRDELIVIAIHGKEVFEPTFLAKLRDIHYELLDHTPYLDDITSLINARNTRGAAGELIVEDLLEHWPENETQLAAVKTRAMANPLYQDMLLSRDGTTTTIIIKTDAFADTSQLEDALAGFDESFDAPMTGSSEPRESLTDQQNSEVVNKVGAILDQYRADDFVIYYAGAPVVTDVLKKSMMSGMRQFMLIAVVAISLLLFLLFRRISGVALPMLTVILSLLSTLGLMGALGIPIKLPTQILPSFLIAVGVGASVHILTVFFRKYRMLQNESTTPVATAKEEAIAYSLGHSGLAVVMTSLTTAAGLASFAGAQVAPISDLGIIAAIGVMLSLVYTLVLLPTLLAILPIRAITKRETAERHARIDRLLTAIADFSVDRSKFVLVISALILAVGLGGALQIKFSHKPFEWFPEEKPIRVATEFIDANLGGASSIEVIVDTGQPNGIYEPAFMQGLERLNREVAEIDQGELYVGKTLSVADIQKEINKALNENRDAFYTIPNDRELIAQEMLLFENSGSDDLEDFVDSQFSQVRFTARMPWVDSILYGPFIEELRQRFGKVLGNDNQITVTGMATLLGRTMAATIYSMAQSYLFAALVITLMMIILIGSLRIGLLSMIPNLTPIILTLGLLGWLGIPIDLFTMLIGSIAIGLAVDDTIHFMHNYRRYHHEFGTVKPAVRETLLSTGRAMFFTTIVLSFGFFLYMFAELSSLFRFGMLTGFAILMALLADFFLAPALLAQLHQAKLISDDSDY